MGCFLKTPRFPIWVVCSESHFSVLFSLQAELLRDWRAERLFDLFYYDGLANQQEQIRLTVGACLPPVCASSGSRQAGGHGPWRPHREVGEHADSSVRTRGQRASARCPAGGSQSWAEWEVEGRYWRAWNTIQQFGFYSPGNREPGEVLE